MNAETLPTNKPKTTDDLIDAGPMTRQDRMRREAMIRETGRDVVALMWKYSSGYLLDWHQHERIQLLYPSTGVITVRTEKSAWIATPDKALLIPAGCNHEVKMSGVVEMRSLFLNDCVVAENIADCCLVDISPMLRELLRHVVNLPKEYDPEGADGRLMQVILDQISLTPSVVINLPQPANEKIRWIERHLLDNPADARSLEDWAKELGTSSRTLSRRFREDITMSFRDWRLRIRLLAAIKSLALGNSVSKTAHDVGFCSESSFIKRFKKATGQTPGRYFQKAQHS